MLLLLVGLLSLAVVVAAIVFAVRQALTLYRRFRESSAAIGDAIGRVAYAADALASHTVDTYPLDRSLARLAVSRARLRVLLSAWADVGAAAGRVTDVVPRK